ncbi:MAG: TPM domain-containing protein [Caulobacter sp.]|nr:TPM domain-containing protein [Caulobacter sp.]
MRMTKADQDLIAAAVARAETTTAGEIYCVLAPRASDYREVPLAWAAGLSLGLPILALLGGFRPEALVGLFGGWSIGHAAAQGQTIFNALAVYIALQAGIFLATVLLVSIPPVRHWMTPSGLKAARVRQAALDQFLSHGLQLTRERTGVLIFASLAERRAEVIADEGVYAAAPKAVWAEVVALLTAGLRRGDVAGGYVAAIERSRQILAEHVPPRADNPNELSDRIVLLGGED